MDVDTPQNPPPSQIENAQASGSQIVNLEIVPEAPPPKKKRERREPAKVERPPGKTLLPISKVQHIIKADKDIAIVAKEATFLISCATEEFIKRLGEAAMALAERDKRTTLQYKDMATVVRKADEFLFLEEIIPWTSTDVPAKRSVKISNIPTGAPTMLDQFVVKPKDGAGEESRIIMAEDGTMHVADSEMGDDFA
ncbi:histone-fold-containing protein [Mycena alexandri]|uniref:Histone-fold-containing protein n=1 Tax=Mycena alexandri TaxID=1745969 RepID=A0AAD6XG12_9AGAR|nr:histone-fold-containing protein [Mycena alexandri]